MDKSAAEKITQVVYGETFSKYTKDEYIEFMRPLEIRFRSNGISTDCFKGKKCLDAGCGGGRGSIFMARSGAAEVTSFDLTPQNLETTRHFAGMFGLKNIRTQQGSLLELPFEDESFDVVFCNGVLHHTVDPDKALQEVSRVLKVGGQFWLYLYGSGGVYWNMVRFVRSWLKDTTIPDTVMYLAMNGYATGQIAEFIDDWYVPMLKAYTPEDVSKRLIELGFSNPQRKLAGTSYDTSARQSSASERNWMGAGDVRYWSKKTGYPLLGAKSQLPDVDNFGSAFKDAECVTSFAEVFSNLAKVVAVAEERAPNLRGFARVSMAARMQLWLRSEMSKSEEFDGEKFREFIVTQTARLERFFI